MSMHDEMSDHEILRAAADSLSGLSIARPPDLESIMARGRARRARRARHLTAAASLSAARRRRQHRRGPRPDQRTQPGPGSGPVPAPLPPPDTGPIRTAAFTLASNPDGTATLTINAGELLDTAALQRDLTQYGIPAKVTSGRFCLSDPAPGGFSRPCSSMGRGSP